MSNENDETCVSNFSPMTVPWEGFGINIRVDDAATITNQLRGLNAQWSRIYLETSDPGVDGIYFDNETFDLIWERSENIQTQITRFAYSTFELMGSKFIFTARSAPLSWLTSDGTNELRGDALVAFARYFASAIIVHRKFGMPVDWVEILDEPSTIDGTFISPENYVILVQTFKSILIDRMSTGAMNIQVMGPGLSYIVTQFQTVEPYIAAFADTNIVTDEGTFPLLDAWSIHVVENETDRPYFNAGTFEARMYVRNQLRKTILFMNWAIPNIPVYVTKYGTNATKYSLGVDYASGAPETVEYAMRLMDNVCGIVSSGSSSALCWFLNFKNDKKALYRNDGSRRPQRDALALLNKIIPTQGNIFVTNDTNLTNSSPDQTIKTFVVSRNSFGFILSRPHLSDECGGRLKLKINNSEWMAPTYRCTVSLYSFPNYISLGSVTKEISAGNGILSITLTNLPYNCVIFGKGDVYATPTLLIPTIPKSPVYVPRVYDPSLLQNVDNGDVVFNVQTGMLMIYVSGEWRPCQTYEGIQGTV